MIQEIRKNIYRITVNLPHSPLKVLNSYFIRGDRRDLLIDTGYRYPQCQKALQEALDELQSDPFRRDVLISHLHSDHIGMADLFAGPGRYIFMEQQELELERRFLEGKTTAASRKHYLAAGMSGSLLDRIDPKNPIRALAPPAITEAFVGLPAGAELEVGGRTVQILSVPGHTPHNCVFWIAKERIMFTGDHVLFDITPNICAWPEYSIPDSLGNYIASLRYADSFPVELALPGHRETGDFHKRIREILEHHRIRLQNCLEIIRETPGLSAYEIAGRMRWKIRAENWEEFPIVQKWFAVGECMAHLDYLRMRGEIDRELTGGVWHYYENKNETRLIRI